MIKHDALAGKSIKVGGVDMGVAIAAERVPALLVGTNPQDVRAFHVVLPEDRSYIGAESVAQASITVGTFYGDGRKHVITIAVV